MEKIIVYVNDVAHALQMLAPMREKQAIESRGANRTCWIVVGCPPRMTRHVSIWLTHAAHEAWRSKWSEPVFRNLTVALTQGGDQALAVLAKGSLIEMTLRLRQLHGPARVLDARRTPVGGRLLPVTAGQPIERPDQWSVPAAMVGMGAVLALVAD